MRQVEEHTGEALEIDWRSFPLEQVNSKDEDSLFWDKSPEDARSLHSFLAAEAVRDQDPSLLSTFLFALLHAVHVDKKPVHSLDTIRDVASRVQGLDVNRLLRDIENRDLRSRIERDYRRGVDEFGVFGTPTMLFPDGDAVFVKMNQSEADKAHRLYEEIRSMSVERPYVQEIKKPRRPGV